MKSRNFAGAVALALIFAAAPAVAQDIDTTGARVSAIGNFGVPNTSTYGQTFTVGSESALNSFSLYLEGESNAEVDFRAYVYAWDGQKAVGDALYRSDIQGMSNGTYGVPVEFSFDTTGLQLTSGNQYVAFLTTAGQQIERPNATVLMPRNDDVYAGGAFVFLNSGNDFAALTRDAWVTNWVGGGDVWFKADFSAGAAGGVPEPAAWAMMIGGFGLAGGALRARTRKVAFA